MYFVLTFFLSGVLGLFAKANYSLYRKVFFVVL